MVYNYETVLARWEAFPALKVRYGDDETGWAKQLAPQCVCIANLPWTEALYLYDICALERPADPEELPQVGEVLQHYYSQRVLVQYQCVEAQAGALLAHFRAFCAEMRAAGCDAEGIVSGTVQVQGRADCDLQAVIQAAAQVAGLTVQVVATASRDADE
jgi:hypothetical protein